MNYMGDALTNTIVPTFSHFHNEWSTVIRLMGLCCFLLAIVWRLAEVSFSDEPKQFPLLSILGNLILSVLLVASTSSLFSGTIALFNYIADLIFDLEKTRVLAGNLWSESQNTGALSMFFNMTVSSLATALATIISQVTFYVLGYLRYFLLCILFVFAPFAFTLFQFPLFGGKYLAQYILTLLQVSSWPVFISILNVVVSTLEIQKQATNSIEYISILTLYCVCLIFIPKIAAILIGGADFSILSAVTVGLAASKTFNSQTQLMKAGAKKYGPGIATSIRNSQPFHAAEFAIKAPFKKMFGNHP